MAGKMTKEIEEMLIEAGYGKSDLEQISRAYSRTKYTYSETSDAKGKERFINATTAKMLLGEKTFWSGLARSAFHYTACRECIEKGFVYFDSSKLFGAG